MLAVDIELVVRELLSARAMLACFKLHLSASRLLPAERKEREREIAPCFADRFSDCQCICPSDRFHFFSSKGSHPAALRKGQPESYFRAFFSCNASLQTSGPGINCDGFL